MILGTDIKKNNQIEFSTEKSRVVLITGKRGCGKSYTLGVLAEELLNDALLLLIDPLGIFWTFCLKNTEAKLKTEGLPTTILVAGDPQKRYGADLLEHKLKLGLEFQPIRLNPSDISPSGWCQLFDLTISEPQGIALFRAVLSLTEKQYFSIDELCEAVMEDGKAQDKTKEALLNRLDMAKAWDIFSISYEDVFLKLSLNSINVLDLSVLDPGGYGLANLIVSVLCRDLFIKRVKERQRENLSLSENAQRIWLLIDEAQRFVPAGKSTFSKEILISWVKEGRQPGLSAVFATQQPSSIDNDILSQCDLILCHRLSNREDIAALNKLSQDYLGNELKTYIRHVKNQGEALMLDDFSERMAILKVKPRRTLHGGGEKVLKLFYEENER
jgi:DNA helicase HerA-like ATPase